MTPPAPRIDSLDFIRGVAVMGILVANLPAFGLPEAAYFSPLAWGGSAGWDRFAWFATYVLVEGKMRGLFSMLFGASMLLVVDRARAAGNAPAGIHYARMATLFAIGCAHLYLIWWGDILSHYALVGTIAFVFVALPVRPLVSLAFLLVAVQAIIGAETTLAAFAAAARNTPATVGTWTLIASVFGQPPRADLLGEIAAMRSGIGPGIVWRWAHATSPFALLPLVGAETLGYMLIGMAGLKSGFLTGRWSRGRYARIALVAIGATLPIDMLLAFASIVHGFDQRWIVLGSVGAATVLRPLTFTGYAALLMLTMRPAGWLTTRIAAAGRAAFTNYLGTTILMTFVFDGWGLGLFGALPRATLYLFVLPVWAAMLAWSRPWLARYRFGPLEWGWRTIARLEVQPWRR
ncbi:DUF418 domain-containing protein [uncultured Sphingomonas sp.]|uniref:DUF418 domain-containing protein n=1 Tax=uncultured Sphingomonas sp. TaxID=158754 RepID=UPI0035CA7936